MNNGKLNKGTWYLFVTFFILSVGTCAWWLYYPYEPVVIHSIRICNPDKTVIAGEDLIYKITYEKKMNIRGKLTRKIIDGSKVDLADSDATAPIGKDSDKIRVRVPKYTDPGTGYYLYWHVEYQVNPLRKVVVIAESDKFTVVKK